MKLTKDQFRRLQELWYDLLASSGFSDIEKFQNGELVLIHPADHCYRHHDAIGMHHQEEYFRFIAQIAEDPETEYKSEIDRFILIRYAEGAKSKDIIKELSTRGTPVCRKTVYNIIRRYILTWRFKAI